MRVWNYILATLWLFLVERNAGGARIFSEDVRTINTILREIRSHTFGVRSHTFDVRVFMSA